MVIDHIYYPGHTQDYPAYVIRPKVAYVGPAVLVLHDRRGLTDHMLKWSERLVHEGFIVMLPDLYQGAKPQDDGEARQWMNSLPSQKGQEEVRMAAVWLRNQAYTRDHAIAVLGFERFGTWGLLTANMKRFPPRAVIAISSPVKDLIAEASAFQAAVQLHWGENDKTVSRQEMDDFAAALTRAGISHEVHTYPQARHDFMCEGCDDYDAQAAQLALEHILAFLNRTIAAEPAGVMAG